MSTSQRLDGQEGNWGTCVQDLLTPGKQLSLLWLNFSVSKQRRTPLPHFPIEAWQGNKWELVLVLEEAQSIIEKHSTTYSPFWLLAKHSGYSRAWSLVGREGRGGHCSPAVYSLPWLQRVWAWWVSGGGFWAHSPDREVCMWGLRCSECFTH